MANRFFNLFRWVIIVFALLMSVSQFVVKLYRVDYPYPLVRGFPMRDEAGADRCDITLNALYLLRGTIAISYRDQSVVSGAFESIRSDNCYIGNIRAPGPRKKADLQAVREFRASGISLANQREKRPAFGSVENLLEIFALTSPSYNPTGSGAEMRSMIENYRQLNTGNGIGHYLSCDYPIRREPNLSYYAVNMYLFKTLGPKVKNFATEDFKLLEKCGVEEELEALIVKRLDEWSIPFRPEN